MQKLKRVASYAALSIITFAAGVNAAPLFAAEGPTFAPPREVVQPIPVEPIAVKNEAAVDEVPATAKFSSLGEMVAAIDTTGPLTAEEDCLAVTTYFEAKSESLEGQYAVAEVLLNRVASGRFAKSLCGVVKQRGQFSFVRGGRMPAVPRASRDWHEAVAIAKIAMARGWDSAAPKALFFHARHVSPGWRLTRVGAVGNHVFYR